MQLRAEEEFWSRTFIVKCRFYYLEIFTMQIIVICRFYDKVTVQLQTEEEMGSGIDIIKCSFCDLLACTTC